MTQRTDIFVADRRHYRAADPSTAEGLRALAALNRVNALACVASAAHGWLGGSFSCAELLTTALFGLDGVEVALSKGHAAAMLYACLYGLGKLSAAELLRYKDGPSAPQAHTDRATPGVLIDTGSLGQALSKTAGLAFAERGRRFVVVLGDGELQEGQCFEAFQTVLHRELRNLVVVVDANGWQTAKPVAEVKALDPVRALDGLGFEARDVDGHDPLAVRGALTRPGGRPVAVVARTVKGGGSPALAATASPGEWHGRVPDAALRARVVEEQVALVGSVELRADWEAHLAAATPPPSRSAAPREPTKSGSTGEHLGRALRDLTARREDIVVLDADLAAPCRIAPLEPLLGADRFVEMGIAEQDMVSFAGGLALAGRRPVVNTYAAFFARAVEQMRTNLSESRSGALVYAGHYAGLPYFSDGKSHQSLGDLGLMRCLPGLVVADPATGVETEALLRRALEPSGLSLYLRLRRSGFGLDDEPRIAAAWSRRGSEGSEPPTWRAPLALHDGSRRALLVTTGPPATHLALDAWARVDDARWGLAIQSVFGPAVDRERWLSLLDGVEAVVTVEDGNRTGGLYSYLCERLQELGQPRPRVRSLSVEGYGPSFRSYRACAEHHGFTIERLLEVMGEALSG